MIPQIVSLHHQASNVLKNVCCGRLRVGPEGEEATDQGLGSDLQWSPKRKSGDFRADGARTGSRGGPVRSWGR